MALILKSNIRTLSVTGFIFLFGFLFFTPVHDDYGSFLMSMASMQFSNFSFIDLHYQGFIWVSYFYKFLYGHFPRYNWMAIFFMGFEFIGLYLLLWSVQKIALKKIQNAGLIVMVQLLFGILFIENITSLSHTRFSLLFCGLSLFYLAFVRDIKWGAIIFYSCLFIIGMLHRPESSIGMLLLVGLGALIYRPDVRHYAKVFFIPVAATLFLFSCIAYNWQHTTVFMEKIEPEVEYKFMDKRVVDISRMETPQDSIKYQVARLGIWFDPTVLTPAFLRSIQLPGANLSRGHAVLVISHVVELYLYHSLDLAILAALVLFCFFSPARSRILWKIILFQLVTFAIVYGLDYNGLLVAGRHFLNIQLISLLISLFYFCNENTSFTISHRKLISGLSILILIVASVFTINHYKDSNRAQAFSAVCREKMMDEIESKIHNRIIAVQMEGVYLLDHPVSFYNRNYVKNTYILYDAFTYSLIPEYTEYLKKFSGCDPLDPTAFFTWLSKQKALYLTNTNYFELTEKYMQLIHHLPLKFKPIPSVHCLECLKSANMKNMELRAISIEN